MRFGCAIPSSHAEEAAAMGFEFIEMRATELAPEGPVSAFQPAAGAIARAGIPAATYNFLLPPDLKVVGPDADRDRLRAYVGVAAERAASIGGRTFVFGSGGARRVPDGFPLDEATRQYRDAVMIVAEGAAQRGLDVAMEGLSHTEANLFNLLSEGIGHAEALDRPNVGVVVDSYHMHMEGEPFRVVLEAGPWIRHVQVCDTGRLPPGSGTLDFRGLFIHLNAAGYDGTVAIESAFQSFRTEGAPSLAFLREAAKATGDLDFVA